MWLYSQLKDSIAGHICGWWVQIRTAPTLLLETFSFLGIVHTSQVHFECFADHPLYKQYNHNRKWDLCPFVKVEVSKMLSWLETSEIKRLLYMCGWAKTEMEVFKILMSWIELIIDEEQILFIQFVAS